MRSGGAGRPGEQGVAHRTAHQGEAPAGRHKAARHLFGGFDVGAELSGNGRGLHPPTVVRPLASPCVDARARTALCTLAVAVTALVSTLGTAAAAGAEQARTAGAPLVLLSQTPWVSAAQPWFNLEPRRVPVRRRRERPAGQPDLLYGRFDDGSDLQQALSGTPSGTPLSRIDDVPVTDVAGVLDGRSLRDRSARIERVAPRPAGPGSARPATPGAR